jgi:conjugative relaxase-like TrwC/TraI family protein
MLRVTTQYCAEAIKQYFSEALHHEDYYSQGTEVPGVWNGKGAERLGLAKNVGQSEFYRLTDNLHPSRDSSLTPRTKPGRRIGYDFCFNVPKSVSTTWALHGDEKILWAFRKSVWQTMEEIELETQTRVRRDGANHDRHTGNMVWAEYLHYTTRPIDGIPDPHIHMHCFVFNCTYDKDEHRWKAGQFHDILKVAPTFQATYFSHFASNLVEIGYPIRRTEFAFEIDGVPETANKKLSRRTEYIESLAADLGFEDKQKASLGVRTRERKRDELRIDDLRKVWADRLDAEELAAIESAGLNKQAEPERKLEQQNLVESLRNDEWSKRADARETTDSKESASDAHLEGHRPWGPHLLVSLSANNAVKAAAAQLFHFEAVVTEPRLREAALKMSYGHATPQQIKEAIQKRPELVERTIEGRTYITTHEAVKDERFLVDFARNGRGAKRALGLFTLSMAGFRLDAREKEVLRELLNSKDRITLFKHTGPSRRPELSRAAMTSVQESGHKLFVVTPSTVSARQAEQDYGLDRVFTVNQLIDGKMMPEKLKEWGKGFKLIWVEDAGRLGTRSVAALARLAKATGARILLSGDSGRARSQERGDPFRVLRDEAGLTSVEYNVMQEKQNGLERALHTIQWSGGEAAMRALKDAQLVHISGDDTLARDAASYYIEQHELGRKPLLVTPGLRTMGRLVKAVRTKLRDQGVLKGRERSVLQLRPCSWGDSIKRRSENYRKGLIIEFHQPSRGFRSGDRTRVMGVDSTGGVWVWSRFLTPERLKLGHSSRFTVHTVNRAHLAVGDRIRVTRHTRAALGRPLRSNSVVTVNAFNPRGDIVVDGMRILNRNFGHFEHDYVTTHYGLKGRRADSIGFIAEAGEYAKAEAKDVVAAGEASKKSFQVFADDEVGLTNLLAFERPVTSAIDVEDRLDELDLEMQDYEHIFNRTQSQSLKGYGYGR